MPLFRKPFLLCHKTCKTGPALDPRGPVSFTRDFPATVASEPIDSKPRSGHSPSPLRGTTSGLEEKPANPMLRRPGSPHSKKFPLRQPEHQCDSTLGSFRKHRAAPFWEEHCLNTAEREMSRFNQHEKGVRQHEPNPACQHDRTQYRTPFLVEADGEVLGASCAVIGVSDKKLRLLWPNG